MSTNFNAGHDPYQQPDSNGFGSGDGWHPDPNGNGYYQVPPQQPYQGAQFQGPQQPPPAPPKKKHTACKLTGAVLGAFLVISGIVEAVNGGGSTATVGSPVVPASAPASTAPSAPAPAPSKPASAPEKTQKAAPVPKHDDGPTFGQKQALGAAESYLDTMPFSKKGLIGQLKFDKFPAADAKWAANHVDADWNEQAVLAAKSYLNTMPMSEGDLEGQLEFDGFTPAQAHHGASVAYGH